MPFFVFNLTSNVTLYSVKVQALLPAPPKSLENTEFSRLFCFSLSVVTRLLGGRTTYGGVSADFQFAAKAFAKDY